jgi:glycosyltransferase involved in cell wall biosynthesis
MRVCYFGIYSTGAVYPRNNSIIRGLREAGVTVEECRVELTESFAGRSAVAQSKLRMVGFGLRLLWSFFRLGGKLLRAPRPDLFVVGHPGYFHLHFLWLCTRLVHRGVPIVYDVFIPLYDAVVCDRNYLKPGSILARLVHGLEKSVCSLADLVLGDTQEHCRYLHEEFQVPEERLAVVWVGSVIAAPPAGPPPPQPPFRVLWFGTYIPLHGPETIVRAAKLVEDDPEIQFLMIGLGQLEPRTKALAAELGVRNITYRDWVPVESLQQPIAAAHLVLGIFGATAKAARVIPTKAVDTAAVGRPLLTSDTPAIREAYTHGEDAYLAPAADPEALAQGIRELKADPELLARLGRNHAKLYAEKFQPAALGRQFLAAARKRFPELPV